MYRKDLQSVLEIVKFAISTQVSATRESGNPTVFQALLGLEPSKSLESQVCCLLPPLSASC